MISLSVCLCLSLSLFLIFKSSPPHTAVPSLGLLFPHTPYGFSPDLHLESVLFEHLEITPKYHARPACMKRHHRAPHQGKWGSPLHFQAYFSGYLRSEGNPARTTLCNGVKSPRRRFQTSFKGEWKRADTESGSLSGLGAAFSHATLFTCLLEILQPVIWF